MERINVRVEGQIKQMLERDAKERGVSPSAIVRKLLEEHYQQSRPRESCDQLARRLGLLGSIEGLPANLSANPDQMEGFGRERSGLVRHPPQAEPLAPVAT